MRLVFQHREWHRGGHRFDCRSNRAKPPWIAGHVWSSLPWPRTPGRPALDPLTPEPSPECPQRSRRAAHDHRLVVFPCDIPNIRTVPRLTSLCPTRRPGMCTDVLPSSALVGPGRCPRPGRRISSDEHSRARRVRGPPRWQRNLRVTRPATRHGACAVAERHTRCSWTPTPSAMSSKPSSDTRLATSPTTCSLTTSA
jgi:hypothetical protein